MYKELDAEDKGLIDLATDIIKRNYQEPLHTVGAAILCESGKRYSSINVYSVGSGSCAEQIVLGTALSNGQRVFKKIVAVDCNGAVIPPCGNCRQLLVDYAPHIEVIVPHEGKIMKITAKELLPDAYSTFG